MGQKKPKTPIGSKYYLDKRDDICLGPVDKLTRIFFDGDKEAWSGNVTSNQTIIINQENLFGGIKKDGGVSGAIDVEFGYPNQPINTYMQARTDNKCPAYRGVTGMVYKQFYVGNSNFPKSPKYEVVRIYNTSDGSDRWYPSKVELPNDQMNAAHIIQEIYCNNNWGLGKDVSEIGDTFTTSADTLFDEGFGLSMIFDGVETKLNDIVSDILKTIDGSVYVDPTTGKLELKLARGDYDIETIPEVVTEDVKDIVKFKRPTSNSTANKVILTYTDHETGKPKTVSAGDTAGASIRGSVIPQEIQFGCIPSEELAQFVATRESRKLGAKPFIMTIELMPEFAFLRPMDVFKFTYQSDEFTIVDKICRVSTVTLGDIKSQKVSVEVIEDIFALSVGSIIGSTPNESVPITGPAADITTLNQKEVPYYVLAREYFDETELASRTDLVSGVLTGARLEEYEYSYFLHEGSDSLDLRIQRSQAQLFSGYGELTEELPANVDEVDTVISNISFQENMVPGLGMLNDEIVWITAFSVATGDITIQRAVLDTVPAIQPIGAGLFFIENNSVTYDEYTQGTIVYTKLQGQTNTELLELGNATLLSLSMDTRYLKPYRPRDLQLSFVGGDPVNGELKLDWLHADRTTDTASIPLFHSDSGSDLEPGTTYNITITKHLTGGGTDVVTETGITTETYTLTESPIESDSYDVELESERDGIVSYQKWSVSLAR